MKRLWHDFDLGSRTEHVSCGLHVSLFDTVHFLISQLAGLGWGRPRPCIIDTVLSQAVYRGWDSKPENENSNLCWPHWWTDFPQKADLLSWSETGSETHMTEERRKTDWFQDRVCSGPFFQCSHPQWLRNTQTSSLSPFKTGKLVTVLARSEWVSDADRKTQHVWKQRLSFVWLSIISLGIFRMSSLSPRTVLHSTRKGCRV